MATNINATETTQLTPEAVAEQLRALIPAIPGYVHLPKATARARHSAAAVGPQFIDGAFAAIDASDIVRSGVGATSEELRADADAAARWTSVREVLREMLNGVDAAVLTRKYRVGFAALQAYSLSRSVARRADQSNLLTHIDTMKRHVRGGRGRKQAPTTPETPAPAPVPTPQQ
jgi:hypothetical protein